MNDSGQDEQHQGMSLGDIYFVVFRQKWIIILFSMVGLLGAALLFLEKPPLYQSETTLVINYVMAATPLNPPGSEASTKILNEQEQSIVNTEVEILRSYDLARQVAEAIGPEKILAKTGGGTNRDQAAIFVMKNLIVDLPARGSFIPIIFRHPDPEVARYVLNEVIVAYDKKHAEVHSPVGLSAESLTKETERRRLDLADTEKKLREAKNNIGVTTSVEDAKQSYTERITKNHEDLSNAEAELAMHQAMFEELTKLVPGRPEATNAASSSQQQIPPEKIEEYNNIGENLKALRKMKQNLLFLLGRKEGSTEVTAINNQIAEAEQNRKNLEGTYTNLASLVAFSPNLPGQLAGTPKDPSTESVQIRALKSKIDRLNLQFSEIVSNAAKVDEMEPTILELQRKKNREEDGLKYYSARFEQILIDEKLGTGKAPNISIIDPPTPAHKARPKSFKKMLAMVTIGSVLSGIGLAFLIELFLDTSVKRPSEVAQKLRLPLFISIPDIGRNGRRRFAKGTASEPLLLSDASGDAASKGSAAEPPKMPIVAWDCSHPLRRFYEGLRDRLIVYFEVRNLTHKPKLVAVTSCGKGAGVSSTAVGLAASLSETGDGNVLLVDMNLDGSSQQFYKGKPACGLDDALESETMKSALVQSNIYVATERAETGKLTPVLPGRFASLIPKLKASDYDYIIFDMPPVSQTSMTPRLAGYMDMVLLVIESEKTNQDVVKQATALLAESKVNVSAVLNKTRTYVPAQLHQDLNDA